MPLMAIALVALLVVGGFIAGIILLIRHSARKQQTNAEDARARVAAIGTSLGGQATSAGFELNLDGCHVSASLTYYKGTPTGFSLSTKVDSDTRDPVESTGAYRDAPARVVQGRPHLTVRRESRMDRLGKSLRINREVQTGDALFDDAVYIESDAADADVIAVLGEDRARRAVVALLDLGFKQIGINDLGDTLTAGYQTSNFAAVDPVRLRPAAEHLRAIARSLPRFSGPVVRPSFWDRATFAVTGSIVFAIGALIALLSFKSAYPPITADASGTGMLVGLAAWIVALPILVLLLRGRATSFRMLIICASVLLAGLPMSAVASTIGMNGALDDARPVAHPTHVLGTRTVRGKNSTTYYVSVAGWRDKQPVELEVSRSFMNSVSRGTQVIVTVGPGYFGWEWLRSIRMETSGSSKRR
jgi:hypothetical protein